MSGSYPKIEIEYFNIGGRAELARACLHIGKIPFTDTRISHAEFGANKKAGKYPNGQLPVMIVDGTMIPQSCAMARYAAQLAGLYPSNPLDAFKVDALVDTIGDVVNQTAATFAIQDNEKKIEARKPIAEVSLPNLLKFLESKVTESKSGYIVGDSLSVGDLAAYFTVKNWFLSGILDGIPASVGDNFTELNKYFDRIANEPRVAEFKAADAKAAAEAKARIDALSQ